MRVAWLTLLLLAIVPAVHAADFDFYGRSGDGIELDFGSLPGVSPGASFANLSIGGFFGHSVQTSTALGQGSFASDGRLWVFPNPALDTAGEGDTAPDVRGFQGRLEGSVRVNGVEKSFSVTVQPGYTGAGDGSVGQSFERINRAANNELFVAQQQQRLRYLGYVREGAGRLSLMAISDRTRTRLCGRFRRPLWVE